MRKKNKKLKNIIIIIVLAAVVMLMVNLYIWDEQQIASNSKSASAETTAQTESNVQTQSEHPNKNDPLLTLVNFENPVPKDWEVDLVQLKNGQSIDRRAYQGLQKMIDDARAEGLEPLICSSYRTDELQTRLFNNQVKAYQNRGFAKAEAKKKAAFWVAVPGTSEHQMGLAVDIVSVTNQNLNHSQENTAVQKWLMKNCSKYGFIMRYPSDKSKITKVGYEPWHYRYVGKQAAKEIYEQGVCLEEYLQQQRN